MKPTVLALIPARGGSKSIPHKNIYPVCGKPLIAWTILEAKKCKLIDRVIVSTDDPKIAAVAKKYGAEVPFMRHQRLAGDRTPDLPVFLHAVRWLQRHENYRPDIIVHLWPTSPLRFAEEIDKGIALLASHPKADSVRAVTIPPQTPFKMWLVSGKAKPMRPLLAKTYPHLFSRPKKPYMLPRQSLPKVYVQMGWFHIFRTKTLFHGKPPMFGQKVLPYFVPEHLYTEFDSLKDLMHAEYQLRRYKLKGGRKQAR